MQLRQLGRQHLRLLGNHVPNALSVAIDPSEVLHQSGVAMVNGALGPLTAAEARDFNAIVGEFGASHGGI